MGAADERDIGICEYVSPDIPGIRGTLKRHAADFVVTELDVAQNAVDLDVPVNMDVSQSTDDAADSEADADTIVRFVLRKERMDTLQAVGVLSKALGVPVRAFGFAGLKDHRAITTQEMTVRGASVAAVRAVAHPHFALGRVRRVARPMRLGQLGGNRFRIVLRGVRGDEAQVAAALHALSRKGCVNYYGAQRFGECAARNDEVGRCLLVGDYAAACDALLAAPPGADATVAEAASSPSSPSTCGTAPPRAAAAATHRHRTGGGGGGARRVSGAEAEARAAWLHSGDARTALKLMPRSRTLEREVFARASNARGRTDEAHGRTDARAALDGIKVDRTARPSGATSALGSLGRCSPRSRASPTITRRPRCRTRRAAGWRCPRCRSNERTNDALSRRSECVRAFVNSFARPQVLALPLGMRRLLAHAYFSRVFNVVASERLRRHAAQAAGSNPDVASEPPRRHAAKPCVVSIRVACLASPRLRLRRHGLAPAREGELVIARAKLRRGRGGAGARRAAVHMVSADEAAARTYAVCATAAEPTPPAVVATRRMARSLACRPTHALAGPHRGSAPFDRRVPRSLACLARSLAAARAG